MTDLSTGTGQTSSSSIPHRVPARQALKKHLISCGQTASLGGAQEQELYVRPVLGQGLRSLLVSQEDEDQRQSLEGMTSCLTRTVAEKEKVSLSKSWNGCEPRVAGSLF